MTRAGHTKRDRCDVYVGRPSKWGNPFILAGTRTKFVGLVVTSPDPLGDYERYVRAAPMLRAELPSLRGKVLGCWCVRATDPIPAKREDERCHAQVLARLVEEVVGG